MPPIELPAPYSARFNSVPCTALEKARRRHSHFVLRSGLLNLGLIAVIAYLLNELVKKGGC
jgi:hypothetical protein